MLHKRDRLFELNFQRVQEMNRDKWPVYLKGLFKKKVVKKNKCLLKMLIFHLAIQKEVSFGYLLLFKLKICFTIS